MDVCLRLCYILPVNYPLEGRARILRLTQLEGRVFRRNPLLEPMRLRFEHACTAE
jgi:hypothetical protein